MLVENTVANRQVANAVQNSALEDMYLDKNFIKDLVAAANGEDGALQKLKREVLLEYERQ